MICLEKSDYASSLTLSTVNWPFLLLQTYLELSQPVIVRKLHFELRKSDAGLVISLLFNFLIALIFGILSHLLENMVYHFF